MAETVTRLCACGCYGSLEGRRPQARFYSVACKQRSHRATARDRLTADDLAAIDRASAAVPIPDCVPTATEVHRQTTTLLAKLRADLSR